ncbi:transglycosylase SLT domain-containing protein [Curtobacterium sp. MCBA15_001]|uniref:aggregation-promoting factor C-terminal-like domain-containing protein n=1 Tax=Curtobacterium sp. MCBA15_001 TaxID=1898731 RepID=UPI0020C85D64|nr:transglycosylase SLT domain-containing protein [Curtobacterium sp. MCBA15_001]
MGRHTADIRSDRATRQQFDHPVVSERRAAQNRTRTAGSSVAPAAPAPKSVADNRVSPDLAHAMPVTLSDPRVVKQRRAWAAKPPVATTGTRTTTLNGFMRRRATIPALSFFAVSLMAGGSLFNPLQADVAQAAVTTPVLTKVPAAPQEFSAHGTYAAFDITRDGYDITKPAPPVVVPAPVEQTDTTSSTATTKKSVTPSNSIAPAAATPNPGSAQEIAQQLVAARGWGSDQYSCLVSLWNKESGWRVNAYNPSGAYGIPQALPGSKMASAGADWQTNPATQITWGLNYISGVYGTPCGAWGHSQSFNWY